LAWAAFAVFCLGAALYVEVSIHFDLRQVRVGKGDQWVAAGAAAISALAGSELTANTVFTGTLRTALKVATLALLALDLAGYAILLAAEFEWPHLRYDARRWATVFPLGMTATACMSTATATGIAWLRPLGVVLLWVAVAAWLYLVTNVVALTESDLAVVFSVKTRSRRHQVDSGG
jgi:tellurite resistance protein TehA-like permease